MVKTYSRKRQAEYQVIEDVQERCRLCLARADQPVPIFERADDACGALPLRIMSCVGYEVTQQDCLPNIICTNCHHELEKYYKFRKKCEESYLKLKSHFNATKERERITDVPELHYEICEVENKMIECEETERLVKYQNTDELEPLVIADVYNVDEKESEKSDDDNKVSVCTSNAVDIEETTEIQVIEQSNEVSPDISTFLNAILVELGILVKGDEGLVLHGQGVNSFELETGDDDQVVFELVEEDEAEESSTTDFSLAEGISIPEGKECMKNAPGEKNKKKRGRRSNINDKKNAAWCGACARVFSSASAARRHQARHAGGAARVACPAPACRRTFAQRAVMERHRLLHQDERPFKCPKCPKSYTQRCALAAHARHHAAPGPSPLALHACPLCDRLFLYASGLSRHMLVHEGRTYSCATCGRAFSDRSSLVRHARNAHPGGGAGTPGTPGGAAGEVTR